MAASMDNNKEWEDILNSMNIFENFRQKHELSEETSPKSVIAFRDGRLFVWDGVSRLLSTNLHDTLSTTNVQTQNLLCTDTPLFKVEHIAFNTTGQQLLLWGKKGASVLQLPRKQGKHGAFEGGKLQINCRTIPLAERYFTTNPSIQLLQAAWHPGSDSASHVVFLTSDNKLRIFDYTSPHKAVQITRLGLEGPSYSLSLSYSTFEVALGEIAVAFDFGIPSEPTSGESTDLVYPIYILKGNGDVFLLLTNLQNRRYQNRLPQGPLMMHPPAEDNYGLDVCSIICLHSSPPVLVVATSSGFLHHCVLLNSYDDGEMSMNAGESLQNLSSLSIYSEKGYSRAVSDQSLYVYESVELSLLPVLSENDDMESDVACPIMLLKEYQSEHCYYCCHSAGVHAVSLPWLEKIERFCNIDDHDDNSRDKDELEGVAELQHDQPCIVQHLVCTKPSKSCPPAPVLGLTPVVDPLLGAMLLGLSADGECFIKPLMSEKEGIQGSLLSERPSQKFLSPLRELMRKPFQQQIKEILQRNVCNPILKTSSTMELSLQESFRLLQRATHILREEYIQKQDQAREEIEKRVKILEQQKHQQVTDLKECKQMEKNMREQVSELAESYEDAQDKQEDLLRRAGKALHVLQNQLPILSEAEQGMKTDLHEMQSKLTNLELALNQVKKKFNYSTEKIDLKMKPVSPGMSTSQQKQLRNLLKEENNKISGLIAEVKNLTTVVAP